MPLFGRKVSNAEWLQLVRELTPDISRLSDFFGGAGSAVHEDLIEGWKNAPQLANLGKVEDELSAMKRIYQSFGKPDTRDEIARDIQSRLDTFFTVASLAIRWGKHHYKDASGGPGSRAIFETGFAQRAAITRVSSNGRRFAENALSASEVGTSLIAASNMTSDTTPMLSYWLIEAAQPGTYAAMGSQGITLAQRAVLGSWCFSQGAILGMIANMNPEPFIQVVWNTERMDSFWELANEQSQLFDAVGEPSVGLGYHFMRTMYPQLYGEQGVLSSLQLSRDLKALEQLAGSKTPVLDTTAQWALDTASGLGLGLLRPDDVRQALEAQANPDRAKWTAAHLAGLDIPREPDILSVEEQVQSTAGVCVAFLERYYPEAATALAILLEDL